MIESPRAPTQKQQEIFDWLTSGEARYRHASKLDPETLTLSALVVGDAETKQVFDIALQNLPRLCLLAKTEAWEGLSMLQRLEAHWLADQSGLEGRA